MKSIGDQPTIDWWLVNWCLIYDHDGDQTAN